VQGKSSIPPEINFDKREVFPVAAIPTKTILKFGKGDEVGSLGVLIALNYFYI